MRAAFFVVLLGLLAAASAGRSYRHHVLVEMTLAEDTVSELASVFADLDVWDQRGNTIELLLTPNQYVSLQDLNLPHTVKVQDMSRVIFEERRRIVERTRDGKDMWEPGREGGFFDEFRTYADYETYMNDLVALYPDLLSHYDAGVTFEGRTIKGVKVSVSNSTDRAALYFEAAQHAREWLAPPTNLWILTSFVEDYEAGNNDVVNVRLPLARRLSRVAHPPCSSSAPLTCTLSPSSTSTATCTPGPPTATASGARTAASTRTAPLASTSTATGAYVGPSGRTFGPC